MEPIKYNDTSGYQFMEVLGTEGVFTSLRIQKDTLPKGFHKYSLREGDASFICQVAPEILVNHAGDFITKQPLDLGPENARSLTEDQWSFLDKPFEFEAFFGMKLSCKCQIAQAEAKRDAQFDGPKSKARGKGTSLTNKPR